MSGKPTEKLSLLAALIIAAAAKKDAAKGRAA
jgi:hypothetical protein